MKSKSLLTKLSDFESSLNSFSFEELSSEEATRLQSFFLSFKSQLEEKVWGEDPRGANDVRASEKTISAEQLDQGEDLKRIAAFCHHLRTPLNGILGLADILNDSRLSEEQQCHVQSIQLASRELMNMVIELSEFARVFADLETFEKLPFNFHNLIRDVEYLCNTLIVDKRLELHVQMDSAIPHKLTGDPSKLSQVLLHLLGTTLKREKEGCISLEVQFQHQEEDNIFLEFVISSSVNGPHTPEGNPLLGYRPPVKAAYQTAGDTGLGLPAVKQIINKLEGELYIQQDSGSSATYAFRLPFTKAPDPNGAKDLNQASSTLNGLRVLVFETNPANQKIIERRLKSWGCIPNITENIPYGLRQLDENVDLLLIDYHKEGLEATTLTGQIRRHSNPILRNIPVIALTNPLSDAELKHLQQLGIDDFILKPYEADDLRVKLAQFKKPIHKGLEKVTFSGDQAGERSMEPRKINLLPVLEDCMGKMETLEELLLLYKQKALEFIGSVKLHLDRADFNGMTYACQKVSSSLKLLRTDSLAALVEEMHKTSQTNQDLLHLRFLHQCFVLEYPQVEDALDRAMEALKRN